MSNITPSVPIIVTQPRPAVPGFPEEKRPDHHALPEETKVPQDFEALQNDPVLAD